MLTRRIFVLSSLPALLAACQTTTAPTPEAATPTSTPAPDTGPDLSRALTPSDTRDLRIAQVEVRIADEFRRNAPENGVSNADVLNVMRPAMMQGLNGANASGTIPVRAVVEIENVQFAGDVTVLLGNASSKADARTTLFYIENGQQVGRGVDATGITPRSGGLIGVAMIQSPMEELQIVADSLADATKTRLFGRGA